MCSISVGDVSFTAAGTCTDRLQPGRQRQLQRRSPRSSRASPWARAPRPSPPPRRRRPAAVGRRHLHADRHRVARAWRWPSPSTRLVPVLDHRRCRELPGRRHLHGRLQPGRQRQLQRRPPGPADFAVGKGCPDHHVTSTAPASASVGGPTYTPTATASSGLAVAITIDASSSWVCSITAGVVSYQAAGTCTVDFNQAGNANYNAAPQVQQTIAVAGAPAGHHDHLDRPGRCRRRRAPPTRRRPPAPRATRGLRHRRTSPPVCSISGRCRELHRPSAAAWSTPTRPATPTTPPPPRSSRPSPSARARRPSPHLDCSAGAVVGGADLHAGGHGLLRPGRGHHRRRLVVGGVLDHRRCRQLPGGRAPVWSTSTRPATPTTPPPPRSSSPSPWARAPRPSP